MGDFGLKIRTYHPFNTVRPQAYHHHNIGMNTNSAHMALFRSASDKNIVAPKPIKPVSPVAIRKNFSWSDFDVAASPERVAGQEILSILTTVDGTNGSISKEKQQEQQEDKLVEERLSMNIGEFMDILEPPMRTENPLAHDAHFYGRDFISAADHIGAELGLFCFSPPIFDELHEQRWMRV